MVSAINVSQSGGERRTLPLQYLDMSDCADVDDTSLRLIVENCPQLQYLYLRRCYRVTGTGLLSFSTRLNGVVLLVYGNYKRIAVDISAIATAKFLPYLGMLSRRVVKRLKWWGLCFYGCPMLSHHKCFTCSSIKENQSS